MLLLWVGFSPLLIVVSSKASSKLHKMFKIESEHLINGISYKYTHIIPLMINSTGSLTIYVQAKAHILFLYNWMVKIYFHCTFGIFYIKKHKFINTLIQDSLRIKSRKLYRLCIDLQKQYWFGGFLLAVFVGLFF